MSRIVGRIVFVLVALGILALGIYLLPAQIDGVRDTSTWFRAGEAIQEPGAPLYEPTPSVAPYYGSPVFAALWAPLTLLGRPVALATWLVVVWASVLTAFLLLRRLSGRGWWMLAFLPFIPLLIANGQVDALVVALVAGAALALENDHDAWAGVMLAAAAHTKVYPLVLLPVLLVMGRRQACIWASGVYVAAAILGPAPWAGVVAGPRLALEHLMALGDVDQVGYSLRNLVPQPAVHVLGVVMFGLTLIDARNAISPLRPLALGLAAVMLTSPVIWEHSFVVMALPLAEMVQRDRRWGGAASAVLGFVGVILYLPKNGRIGWTLVSVLMWWMVLLRRNLPRP